MPNTHFIESDGGGEKWKKRKTHRIGQQIGAEIESEVMRIQLFGNLGKRNSIHNGQTQKALQIASLLRERFFSTLELVDSSSILKIVFSYLVAARRYQVNCLCLGPRGLRFVAWLALVRQVFYRPPPERQIIFAVGGWLARLAARDKAVHQLCRHSLVLVEAEGLRDELQALGLSSTLFPNFRDMSVVAEPGPLPSSRIELVYFGRISAAKGYREALSLADSLTSRNLDCRLTFYGPMDDTEFLASAKARPYVRYLGTFDTIAEIAPELAHMHYLVLPSRYRGECVPGAVIEAKFLGLPAIVSDWRFLPEVVSHGRTGAVCRLDSFAEEATEFIVGTTTEAHQAMRRACTEEAARGYSTAAAEAILRALL